MQRGFAQMTIPFEPTRSYAYKAARYELLPRLEEIAEPFGDQPFLLRDLWQPLLVETYTQEQLDVLIPKAQNPDIKEKMRVIIGFYIPFLAEELKVFERLGRGMFRNISLEEELAEVDAVATDANSDDDGIIYAYTFPTIRKEDGQRFPIKIGLTTTGDAQARVIQQCKTTSCFDYPVILATWKVLRVGAVEDAIHSTLEARGSKRDAPGTEWFNTTLDEIETVVKFIQPNVVRQVL
jgi:hypothetical protein